MLVRCGSVERLNFAEVMMMKRQIAEALAVLMIASAGAFPAMADEWDLSEDGKHWMYFDYAGEPLTDEWIEVNGKTYYLDTKGYMKTGWVTNKGEGTRHYMGEDGAMLTDTFTPDDKYVGPDGAVVTAYDNYRKKVKAEIKKAAKTKKKSSTAGSSKTAGSAAASSGEKKRYFLLTDLNRDGYQDLVVTERTAQEEAQTMQQAAAAAAGRGVPLEQLGASLGVTQDQALGQLITNGNLIEIAVWDPEEGKFQLSAEFDETGEVDKSTLYLDPEGQGIWLEIRDDEDNLRLFQMEMDTSRFENVWSFAVTLDDWGGALYQLNGEEEDKAFWDMYMAEALQARGNTPLSGYLAATDENVTGQVDLLLTEEELDKWQ